MITRYVILDAEYMDDAITADRMTASMSSGSRYFSFDTSEFLVHIVGDTKLVIQVDEGTGALSFIPVANRVPVDAKTADATLDYRNGYGSVEDAKDATVPEGQRRPVESEPLVLHASFEGSEMSVVKNTILTGSSSWYGDTDNVISWNGIGAMDGCGNDYRTYRQMNTGRYYNTPGYEATYYHANDRNTPPDSGGHLMGDGHYITDVKDKEPSPKPKAQWNTALFVNGSLTKHALGPVLAACEVAYTTGEGEKKTKLRVLVGRWLPPEDKYTPVSGDPDFLFESMTLNGFYLYDEDEDSPSGWSLKIIDIPVLDAHPDYPNTSFLAQAPHFSPDGTVAVGIIETGLGGAPVTVYYDGKLVTKTQAWVFKIDVAAGTCALTEPAGTYRTEKDSDVDADLLNSTYTRTQILAVAPENASSIITCKRIEAVALVKSRKDSETTYPAFVPGDYSTAVFRNGSRDAVRAEMQSVFSRMTGEALAGARGIWGMGHTSVSFVIWQDNYPALDSVYPQNPYLGGVGYMSLGVGFFTDTGEIWTSFSDPWWGVGNNIEVYYPATSYSRSQTNTTTTSHKLLIGPHEVAESKIDTVRTAGYRIGFHGDGYAFTGMLWTTGWGASAEVYLYRSFGPVLETDSSTTTGALQGLRLAAADPRKSAGIVRNLTTGALTFKGVASPSGGF